MRLRLAGALVLAPLSLAVGSRPVLAQSPPAGQTAEPAPAQSAQPAQPAPTSEPTTPPAPARQARAIDANATPTRIGGGAPRPRSAASASTKSGAKPRAGKLAPPVDAAIATMPGFRTMPGGRSLVTVRLSKRIDVLERKAEGRLVYALNGAWVTARTNLLPLPTGFFSTPVASAQLALREGGVDLVIDLRQASEPTYRLLDVDGAALLQIEFAPVQPGAPMIAKPPAAKSSKR